MSDSKKSGKFEGERARDFERLWQNAVQGLEDLKDVMLRASQSAKVKLDATFLRRERDRLYQQLGEQTYLLIEDGELQVPQRLRDTVDRIHALVEQLAEEEAALGDDDWSEDTEEEEKGD